MLAKPYVRVTNAFEGNAAPETISEESVQRKKRWARLVYTFFFAMAAAYLLVEDGPQPFTIPVLSVGDIASQDIYSPVTTYVEPESRLELDREELAKRVAPVFDYDDSILNVWISNWEHAIKTVRNEYYKLHRKPSDLEAVTARIEELTHQVLPAKDLLYLHQESFSYVVERTFLKIANRLVGRLISANDLFPSYYSTGIIVREVNRSLHETVVNDVSRIWSVDHAREFLRHVPSISENSEKARVTRIVEIVNNVVVPNLKFNASLTKNRIATALGAARPVVIPIKQGQLLVSRGTRITDETAEMLKKLSALTSAGAIFKQFIFQFIILLIFFAITFRLSLSRWSLWHRSLKDAILFMIITLLSLFSIKYALPFIKLLFPHSFDVPNGIEYLLPVAAGGIILQLLMGKDVAYSFAIIHSALIGIFLNQSYFFSLWAFTVTAAAARFVQSCRDRNDLFKSGLLSGALGAAMVFGYLMTQSMGLQNIAWMKMGLTCGLSIISGLVSGIIGQTVIPLLESMLGYTTSLKLLELSSFNHPLLHQLMIKAPGTYHHSLIVGSLAELAADKVRANGLLARVAAYYHDIGKMNKPLYYIENQSPNDNPHDHLAPTMSVKILFSHVKNGVRLAQQFNLGKAITDIIDQHHGTTLVTFFFNKAKKLEQTDHYHINEADFRYPCPRPTTREAGIVMLADACEAAARCIADPSASKIENLVHELINRRFIEEQFSECHLTLSDLRTIEECFTRTLVSLYHHRIDYPGQKTAPRPESWELTTPPDTKTDQEAS